MPRIGRRGDPESLRQFKADFFKALAHPMRIRILELLRSGPKSFSQLIEAIGAPPSSISQQLAVLRGRNIVDAERRGTSVIFAVRDSELFELLDAARTIFNAHLSDTIELLRLVESEADQVNTDLADGP
ncbi:MAG TPA: metalloregulator ArsR/SmtB family transcription factor [Candidatus Limnocylindrales bacterium]|jgi:DNA-binding transcriptional ArsR family regulator